MRIWKSVSWIGLLLCLITAVLAISPVQAGERLLTVNNGTNNDVWFIEDEPSLVMNGFDLTPLQIVLPAVIDKVTLTVDTPVPAETSEIVIYQDFNGGSPVDAELVGRQTTSITSTGSVTISLLEPVTIHAPVVWVGFYLPVGFRFLADTSGSSVLTYWAWTPGGTFDLANLTSAQVFGPADGSAPVNMDMGGKARITAEITSANPLLGTPVVFQAYQVAGTSEVNLGVLVDYPNCDDMNYDGEDELISYGDAVNLHCVMLEEWNAPPSPEGYERKEELYNVFLFSDQGIQPNLFPIRVTHCIEPNEEDLESAVIGVAYGAPRVWRILPSQRYGTWVCAEIPHDGNISYFVPISDDD